jgi:CRP-like cAMP-binding protein
METLATLSVLDRVLALRRVPLFASLPSSELRQVAAIASERWFGSGEVIARQGEPGDEMYIIVSGAIGVVDRASGKVVARRGPGEYVGEMAVLSLEPRMASLVAEADVRVLVIEQTAFGAILRERPETSLALIRELCQRLKAAQAAGLAATA